MSIRHAAGKPIKDSHLPSSLVIVRIQKAQEAYSSLLSEMEPELLFELIQKEVCDFGSSSFVGIRQAVLYILQYCSKSSFSQVKWLQIGGVFLRT